MRHHRVLTAFACVLVLCGFGSCQRRATPPEKIYITVTEYVPVPAALTPIYDIADPKELTCAEAVRVARERKASLEKCNVNSAAIRKLGEKP